jgi:hypothetical protein
MLNKQKPKDRLNQKWIPENILSKKGLSHKRLNLGISKGDNVINLNYDISNNKFKLTNLKNISLKRL